MWDRRLHEALTAWARIDAILAESPYTLFYMDTNRDYSDPKKRVWLAVILKEGGKVLARATGLSRNQAVVNLVHEYDVKERA